MAPDSSSIIGGITLVHSAFGDFFVPEETALHEEVRETGGHARSGLAMLSARLGPGGTVLDIGAGVGMLAVPLQLRVGNAGRVWCFEPDADAFRLLRWNLAVNGVDLLARAVAGDTWPRLDDWCRTAEVEHIDAIRIHGPAAAAALAERGRETVETHLPLLLFTLPFGARPATWDDGLLERQLPRLGYVLHWPATTINEEANAEPALVTGPQAATDSASLLAVPARQELAGGLNE